MVDNNEIVIAQMARVYLAPVGTPAPAGPAIVMPAAWREVGLFTPDSLAFATDPTFEEVASHQSLHATRRFQTADAASLSVDLQQWNGENFKAVYGGGTLETIAAVVGPPAIPMHYRFSPPAIGGRTEVAAVVEIVDGLKHYRRIVPRCQQNEGVEQAFARTAESTLPLRLSVLGSDVGDPWYDLSDDPSFAPAA
jgi:hypothetical protein